MSAQAGQQAWPRNLVYWESSAARVVEESRERSGVNLNELDAYASAVIDYAKSEKERNRRAATGRRRLLVEDCWAPLLRAFIEGWVKKETADAVMGANHEHVDTVKNVATDIWSELAVLYDAEALRSTDPEDAAKRYLELAGEDFDSFWADVDFALEAYNDVIVWPSVIDRDGQKIVKHNWAVGDTVTVVENEDDPTELDAIVFIDTFRELDGGKEVTRYKLWTDRWHAVYDDEKKRVDRGDGTNPYGTLDVFVCLHRKRSQLGFWNTTIGEALIKATLHIGRLRTFTNYCWKMSSHKQLALTGPDALEVKAQQLLDPSACLRFGGDVNLQIIDWQIDFDARGRYQDAEQASAAASRGINPEALKRTANYQNTTAARLTERPLREWRRRKVRIFRPAERRYFRSLHTVASSHGISKLYNPKARLDIEFGPIDYPDDPAAQLDYEIKAATVGVSSALEMLRQRNPTLTREQALKALKRNLEVTGQINEMKASRNVPDNLTAESRTAEENGRMGPIIRDAKRNQGDPVAGG